MNNSRADAQWHLHGRDDHSFKISRVKELVSALSLCNAFKSQKNQHLIFCVFDRCFFDMIVNTMQVHQINLSIG